MSSGIEQNEGGVGSHCGISPRWASHPSFRRKPARALLRAYSKQLQAGGGNRLESVNLLGVGGGDHIAEDQRVDHGLLGEQILNLAPLSLGSVTVKLNSLVHEALQLLERFECL